MTITKKIICFTFLLTVLHSGLSAQSWSAFGFGPIFTDVNEIIVDTATGTFYAGGQFMQTGAITENIAMKNGAQWTAMGPGLDDGVYALAMYNGNLYAGGYFTAAGAVSTSYIAMWNGTTWSPVGTGLDGAVFDLAVFNGELYATGNFTQAGSVATDGIAKWNGVVWTGVGGGLDDIGLSMLSHNGVLYVGGWFTIAGTISANYIAAWDGTSWSALGSGTSSSVMALAIHEGELYLGGTFTQAGGNNASYIAKWNGSGYEEPGGGVDNAVEALVSYNCELYVAGFFSSANGVPIENIARYNTTGGGWSPVGTPEDTLEVWDLLAYNGDLYAAGANIASNANVMKWNSPLPAAPQAQFISSEEIIHFGNYVQYFYTGTGAVSFQWTFQGGIPSVSNLKHPIIFYPNTGQFDVSLIASNCIANDTLVLSDYITVDSLIHQVPSGISSDFLTINTPPNTTIPEGDYNVHYYKPSTYDSLTSPILFYIHGIGGSGGANSELYDIAERQHALIVSPTMHVGVFGYPYVSEIASDSITGCDTRVWMTEIMKQIYRHVLNREQRSGVDAYLTGFSAGAQFTSRYMLIRQFSPDSIPIKMAVSVSASNYTLMTDTFNNAQMLWSPYKCGLDGSENMVWGCGPTITIPVSELICNEHIMQYYNENYGILVGMNDTYQFPSYCGYAQGTDRFDRAKVFHSFSMSDAIARGTTLQWMMDSIFLVPHSGYQMYNTKLFPTDTISIAENMLFNTPYHSVPQLIPTCLTGLADDESQQKSITIIPNPNNGLFTLQLNIMQPSGEVRIVNSTGSIVYNQKISNHRTEIDLSNKPAGLYFYIVTRDGEILDTGKVVKN